MSVPVEYFKDVAEASGSQVEYDELVLKFLQESEMTEGNCSFQEVREFAVERLSRAYNEKKCLKSLQALVGSGKVLKLHGGFLLPEQKRPAKLPSAMTEFHAAMQQYNHDLYHRSCWVLSGDDKTAEISEPKMIAVEDCWSYGAQLDVLLKATLERNSSYLSETWEDDGVELAVLRPADMFLRTLIPEGFFLQVVRTGKGKEFEVLTAYYEGCGKDAWGVVLEATGPPAGEDGGGCSGARSFAVHWQRLGEASMMAGEWKCQLDDKVSLKYKQFDPGPYPTMPGAHGVSATLSLTELLKQSEAAP
mmetsp:Transcript_6100/g.9202  ORF Transcript_6100/g.9202 Transcript_6100/m.9202 type:complete len:305 (+) Transcript_6100:35-949(+)